MNVRTPIYTLTLGALAFFFGVVNASAAFQEISDYSTTNYHKSIAVNGGIGLLWTATSTGQITKATFSLCDDSDVTNGYTVSARLGYRSGGVNIWLATSTNSVSEANIQHASSVTGCYGSLVDYPFYFASSTISSGITYILSPMTNIAASNNAYFLIRSPYDTNFNVQEGVNFHTEMTPRFSVSYNQYDIYGVYEVDNPPAWDGDVLVGSEQPLDPNYTNLCFIGQSCLLWFGYSFDSIGADVYLLPGDGTSPDDSEFSPRSLIEGSTLKDYFTLSEPATAVTEEYCLYLDYPDRTDIDKIYCGIEVKWLFDDFVSNRFTDCAADVCLDVASSTGTFDDLRYGVECGLRKAGAWMICPSDNSVIEFAQSYYTLQNSFPLSVLNQVRKQAQRIDLATTSMQIALAPIIPGSTETLTIATSTMGSAGPFLDRLRVYIGFVIYGMFFFYISSRLLSLGRKPQEEV